MHQIDDRLFLASSTDSQTVVQGSFAVLLVCEWPCRFFEEQLGRPVSTLFQQQSEVLVGSGKPYLHLELSNQEIPNYQARDFNDALDVIARWRQTHDVVIMSENAESRSASLALLWLAFRAKKISNSSYRAARLDFTNLYPRYVPWPGLVIFLEQWWDSLR